MNNSKQTRLTSFALASVLTLAMLLGINGLATSDAPSQMAQHSAPVTSGTPA